MAGTIGTAYIQIEPSAKGIEGKISEAISGGSQGYGKALSGALGTAGKIAGAAIAGATTAVGALGAASVKTGAEFDKSMSQVAATMGLTMDDMQKTMGSTTYTLDGEVKEFNGTLRDFAQEMGRNTAFSASQAADALNYMALAGYDVETSMSMLPNVLNLAASGNMELARASDMVTDAATAFGLTLEDGSVDIERTTQLVDEMAKAASTGNTSVEQLGDAFLVVGGLAQELNGGMVTLDDGTTKTVDGVQELEIALTAMANAGVKGSEAGTHMRNMLLKLASPAKDGATAMSLLGLNVFDTEGNMRSLKDIFGDLNNSFNDMTPNVEAFYNEIASWDSKKLEKTFKNHAEQLELFGLSMVDAKGKLKSFDEVMQEAQQVFSEGLTQEGKIQAISDIFNTRDVASAEALLNAISQDWDEIGVEILKAKDAAEQMAKTQLDNLAGDVTLFKSALEGAQIAISDTLAPSLRKFVQFGTDGLSKLTTAFQEGGLTGAMEAFGEVLADGLNMVIEKLPEFVDAGMQLLGALGQGLLDNLPVIIDAAGQIIVQLIEGIATALPELAEGAMQIIGQLATFLGDQLPTLIPTVVDMVIGIVEAIIDNADLIIDGAIALVLGLAEGIINALPTLIEKAPMIIEKLVTALTDNISKLVEGGIQLVTMVVQSLPEIIQGLIDAAPDIIVALVEGLITAAPQLALAGPQIMLALAQSLIDSAPVILSKIGELYTLVAETWVAEGSKLIDRTSEILSSVWDYVSGWGSQILSNIGSFFSNLISSIGTWLSGLPDTMAYNAGYAIGSFIKFFDEMPAKAKKDFDDLIRKAGTFAKDLASKAKEAGKNFFNGVVNEVTSLPGKFRELLNQLVSVAKEFPKKFSDIGKNIVEGLKNGIKDAWDSITGWFKDKLNGLVEGAKDGLKIESPSKVFETEVGRWIPAGIGIGIEKGMDALNSQIRAMNEKIISGAVSFSAGAIDSMSYTPSPIAYQGQESGKVMDLLARYLPEIADMSKMTIEVKQDKQGTFNAVRDYNNMFKNATGYHALA